MQPQNSLYLIRHLFPIYYGFPWGRKASVFRVLLVQPFPSVHTHLSSPCTHPVASLLSKSFAGIAPDGENRLVMSGLVWFPAEGFPDNFI